MNTKLTSTLEPGSSPPQGLGTFSISSTPCSTSSLHTSPKEFCLILHTWTSTTKKSSSTPASCCSAAYWTSLRLLKSSSYHLCPKSLTSKQPMKLSNLTPPTQKKYFYQMNIEELRRRFRTKSIVWRYSKDSRVWFTTQSIAITLTCQGARRSWIANRNSSSCCSSSSMTTHFLCKQCSKIAKSINW